MFDYGIKIKKFRDQKGYSQDFMAERLGISQNAFHKIETGQTKLKANTLQQIADILEVDAIKLLNDDGGKFHIKQKSHDSSTGVAIYSDSFDGEREAWKLVESGLRETLEAQKALIAALKETIDLQRTLIKGP
ncbi:helix-turn-helix domain-containing protein [Dyadobacter bucti]|uniref:helix-turn-helix domain-containing protein n=1 Tax=Dyadobacter bucti TaxID=2572203 RepID=UPI003F72E519